MTTTKQRRGTDKKGNVKNGVTTRDGTKKPRRLSQGSETSAKAFENLALRKKVLEMRLLGLKHWQIAERLDVSRVMVTKWLIAARNEEVEAISKQAVKLRAKENARLEYLYSKLVKKIMQGDVQAILAATRISESRRRLLGLDAPMKTEVSGEVAHGVLVVPSPVTPEEWERLYGQQQETITAESIK